jgi:hypothetical protein
MRLAMAPRVEAGIGDLDQDLAVILIPDPFWHRIARSHAFTTRIVLAQIGPMPRVT